MNAAVVSAFDAPPRYSVFAEPIAAEGEKIVKVTAAGLHPIVKALAKGTHYGSTGELPFIPGVDGVGRLEDGTRVYFGVSRRPFGTFAERAPAANWMCLPLPEGISDVTAAGIANPAMSSWVALGTRAKFVAGESVLILGATGVAGQLAVQTAKRLGARRVIAAGRNPQALQKLQQLGADAIISLHQEHEALVSAFRREWAEAGVEVVLDYLWGPAAESVLEAISQKGLRNRCIPRPVCSDWCECGQSDLTVCGYPAQFQDRTSWQRLRQRVPRSDLAGPCRVFQRGSTGALSVQYQDRAPE